MKSGLTILGLTQPRVRAKFRLRVGGTVVSRRRLPKTQTWGTVMPGFVLVSGLGFPLGQSYFA